MRWLVVIVALVTGGCGDRAGDRHASTAPSSYVRDHAGGEVRAPVAPRGEGAAVMRSGPQVPVRLPRGFTLYPGAQVISNTVVERAGRRRVLLVFETRDPHAKVILFYRAQAAAAAVPLDLDLGGGERASIGGSLPGGGNLAITAQRDGDGTRVAFSAD